MVLSANPVNKKAIKIKIEVKNCKNEQQKLSQENKLYCENNKK